MRRFAVLACLILLSCAPRGEITQVSPADVSGRIQRVFIGTTRLVEADGSYGGNRSEAVLFAQYDIAIPTDREAGSLTFPKRGAAPDPTTDFLTTKETDYSTDVRPFRRELSAALARNDGQAVIFVHGYNNTFAEGLYRVAQLANDLNLPGVVMHYSWPSSAKPLGYAYDRDSAVFARDGLEALIKETERAGARQILIVAHSMGGYLTMEALRQTAIRGGPGALKRISGVLLISPDIDVDVFRTEATDIGTLPQPFLIFGSTKDKALKIAAGLSGKSNRLGSLADVSRLADLKVTFLDVGEFAQGNGHFAVGDNPALIAILGGIGSINSALDLDQRMRFGLIPGLVMTVQNATEIILSPVVAIATYPFP
jgi:esterase/lipase superfamily enzyme